MSADCCNNPFDLGCVTNNRTSFDLPFVPIVDGQYKAVVKYRGQSITFYATGIVGTPLHFDFAGLNENFVFTFNVYGPDGEKVDLGVYNCFRFKTVPVRIGSPAPPPIAGTCPDGVIAITDGLGTVLHTVPVPSGANAVQAIGLAYLNITDSAEPPVTIETVPMKAEGSSTFAVPVSVITRDGQPFTMLQPTQPLDVPSQVVNVIKPDGTNFNNGPGVALDMRDYRSGIVYQFGRSLSVTIPTVSITGDEADLLANGFFVRPQPLYPLNYARLAGDNVMVDDNMYGNTIRLTNRSGAASGGGIIQDHLTGLEWYKNVSSLSLPDHIAFAAAGSFDGGAAGWVVMPLMCYMTITRSGATNYAPFSTITHLWTCTRNLTGANFYVWNASTRAVQAASLASVYQALYCRKFT